MSTIQHKTTRLYLLTTLVLAAVASGCTGGTGVETSTERSVPATTAQPTSETGSGPCSTTPPRNDEPAIERIDVSVGGTARSAAVHVPPNMSESTDPLPVVVSFHGVNGSTAVQQTTDGFLAKADKEGFVVVYPEGLEVGLNAEVTGISGWDADGSEVDEPAFVSAVLDELESSVCVDPARIFATGFSAGGNIALVVACALPERFAAVAPVSGAYQPGECREAPGVPTLAFHGLEDIVVPVGGRDTAAAGTLIPVRDALDAQANRNGCSGAPATTEVLLTVRSLTWGGCDEPVTLVELEDHGHAWPGHPLPFPKDVLVSLFAGSDTQPPNPLMTAIGASPEAMADNVLLTNTDVDATNLIWEFFSTQQG